MYTFQFQLARIYYVSKLYHFFSKTGLSRNNFPISITVARSRPNNDMIRNVQQLENYVE